MNSLIALRRSIREDCQRILELLTTRQYVNPHESVASALTHLGLSDAIAIGGASKMGLAPSTALGRLRRSDLERVSRLAGRAQLGRSNPTLRA